MQPLLWLASRETQAGCLACAHPRVVVPLVDSRVGAEEVEVSAVVHIPHMDTLCALEHHWDGGIIVGAKFVLPVNILQIVKASSMSCHVTTGKVPSAHGSHMHIGFQKGSKQCASV